jgi:PAS domain S-box-containing protein
MNTIFHNAIDAVIVMDDNGIILQWNPKAEIIFGWKADEAIGQYFHETIVPERHRVAHLKRMKRYENMGEDAIVNKTIEITALRKNNTEFDIALGISPTIINGHRFFINFISDITERKIATDKLDKQKEFYENILNSLPTDIAVFDANHKYLFVNPGAIKDEEFRKYIVGKDDFQYCEYRNRDRSIAQRRRDQFLEVEKAGKEIRWEDTIRDTEGNPITHLRRLFPVHNEQGELSMVIGFGIDITDRKIMEEKQTALVKQLSSQNTQLIDFCNIVSHNLRAPLVNMGMLVKFIEETTDEAEQKLLISKLDPVIDSLNTTFNELVESIQIKQDLEIKYENILLDDCLQRTIEGLKTEINNSNAIIETDFTLAPKIYCPPKYLFSIFHNLVSNALKYQSPKRIPHIRLKSEKVDGNIILSVQDNGLGIDLEKHKENFFKIGKVFHRHPNAKGFGLFMTKTHVEAMNGQIWVESTPDVGSTFYIAFKNQDR